MKFVRYLLLSTVLMLTLSGCAISEGTLEDMCYDYAMITTQEDLDVFMQGYQTKITTECLYDLMGEIHGSNQDLSRTLTVYSTAYDREENRYTYFCYRVSNIGFSNDVYITLTLSEDQSKVEKIDQTVMFSAPY